MFSRGSLHLPRSPKPSGCGRAVSLERASTTNTLRSRAPQNSGAPGNPLARTGVQYATHYILLLTSLRHIRKESRESLCVNAPSPRETTRYEISSLQPGFDDSHIRARRIPCGWRRAKLLGPLGNRKLQSSKRRTSFFFGGIAQNTEHFTSLVLSIIKGSGENGGSPK